MRTVISFEELDLLAGEVLPERTVLSTVTTPFNNVGAGGGGDGGSSSAAAAAAGGGGADQGTTALSACQSNQTPGTPGLLGSLGLGSANPSSSVTCTPAAISGH